MPSVGKIRGFKGLSFKGPGSKADAQTSQTGNLLSDKRKDGMTAKEAGAAGYPPAAIREAGYTTEEMAGALEAVMTAGLTASQAYAAGFTHAEMEQAGYSPDMIEATTGQLSEAENGATIAPGVVAPGGDDLLSPKAIVKAHSQSVPPPPEKTATGTTAAPRDDNGGVNTATKRLLLKLPFSTVPKLLFQAGRGPSGKPPSGKPLDCSRSAVDRLKQQNEQQQKQMEQQQSEMHLLQAADEDNKQQLAALQEQVAAQPSPPLHPPLHGCPAGAHRPAAPPPRCSRRP